MSLKNAFNRFGMLPKALLVSTAIGAASFAGLQHTPAPPKSPTETAAATLDHLLKIESHQFIIFGDTDHNDEQIQKFTADPTIIKTLAKNGIKHLFIEERHELQPIIDQYLAGKLTDVAYSNEFDKIMSPAASPFSGNNNDTYVRIFNIIKEARIYNIKVHAVEAQMPSIRAHVRLATEMSLLLNLTARFIDRTISENPQLQKDSITTLSTILHSPRFGRYAPQDAASIAFLRLNLINQALAQKDTGAASAYQLQYDFTRRRIGGDAALAKNIREQAKGERSVIIYGAGHGAHACDLDNLLSNAPKINLYPTAEAAETWTQRASMHGYEQPHYTMVIDRGDTYTAKQMARRIIPHQTPELKKYTPNFCAKPTR